MCYIVNDETAYNTISNKRYHLQSYAYYLTGFAIYISLQVIIWEGFI